MITNGTITHHNIGKSNGEVNIRSALNRCTNNEVVEMFYNIQRRYEWFRQLYLDKRRDIDFECGYPRTEEITAYNYHELYEREPIASRVVDIYPDECWQVTPQLYETEDDDQTEFELAFEELGNQFRTTWWKDEENNPIWSYLHRADRLCGVGRYGVILLGTDDGAPLSEPLEKGDHKLLFLRVLDEDMAKIATSDDDDSSVRFGKPTSYQVSLSMPTMLTTPTLRTASVHWTRCVHIADNLQSDEVLGVPRMQRAYNRLYDLHKLYGGSAEMYWQAALPGISFETHPQLGGQVQLNVPAIKDALENYFNTLKRWFAIPGMHANSLAPQVVEPSKHIDAVIDSICIYLGVPKRVFMGSERGELASSQDAKAWYARCKRRQEDFISPSIIVPFVDHLIQYGILPEPSEYFVNWPDIAVVTDAEEAQVANTRTQALAAYSQSNIAGMITPKDYLVRVMNFDEAEVDKMLENSDQELQDNIELGMAHDYATEKQSQLGLMDQQDPFAETSNTLTTNTVVKTAKGYVVVSKHKGKNGKRKRLGGPYKSRAQAVKRLQQVEYFKHTGNVFCPTGEGGGVDPTCLKNLHSADVPTFNKAVQLAHRLANQFGMQLKVVEPKRRPHPGGTDGLAYPDEGRISIAFRYREGKNWYAKPIEEWDVYRTVVHEVAHLGPTYYPDNAQHRALEQSMLRWVREQTDYPVDRPSQVENVFCPTGEGGGVDPTCSKGNACNLTINPKVLAWAKKKFKSPEHVQAFAKWFGDSKVVDKEGNPLVVYHGTQVPFTTFDSSLNNNRIWFTREASYASKYTTQTGSLPIESGQNIMPLYAVSKHPAIFEKTREGMSKWARTNDTDLRRKGYDSVIMVVPTDKTQMIGVSKTQLTYLPGDIIHGYVFSSNQVKSATGNRGTFDPKYPDIRNVFCATGEGGGIDPTCSPAGKQIVTEENAATIRSNLKKNVATIAKKFELKLGSDGSYFREVELENGKIRQVSIIHSAPVGKEAGYRVAILDKFRTSLGPNSIGNNWKVGSFDKASKFVEVALSQSDLRSLDTTDTTSNVFCPTGEGGGIDPTCSPDQSTSVDTMTGTPSNRPRAVAVEGGKYKLPNGVLVDARKADKWNKAAAASEAANAERNTLKAAKLHAKAVKLATKVNQGLVNYHTDKLKELSELMAKTDETAGAKLRSGIAMDKASLRSAAEASIKAASRTVLSNTQHLMPADVKAELYAKAATAHAAAAAAQTAWAQVATGGPKATALKRAKQYADRATRYTAEAERYRNMAK